MSNHYDAIVVGCGAMGSSVSYYLSKKGLKVATLEQFGLNHELGSSHGMTRIIRLAYYEDQKYVPLLRRAFTLWKDLEVSSGRTLLKMTGGLMIGRAGGELVSGVLRSAKMHGIPHETMIASEVRSRFEAFTIDEPFTAVYEQSAGILFPEECIRAFVDQGRDLGAEFHFSEPVNSWRGTPEHIEVATTKGSYSADKIVFCAGGWTTRLIGGLIPLVCERQVPFWFSSLGQGCFTPGSMPVFIMEEDRGIFFYGIPDVGHGVKVARTHGGEISEPDKVDRTVGKKDSEPVQNFVAKRMEKLGKEPIAFTTCIYTNTPDLDFAVGLHPADKRIAVVSACSGHGFKFAGVIGEAVADVLNGDKGSVDISFLGLERFGQTSRGR